MIDCPECGREVEVDRDGRIARHAARQPGNPGNRDGCGAGGTLDMTHDYSAGHPWTISGGGFESKRREH